MQLTVPGRSKARRIATVPLPEALGGEAPIEVPRGLGPAASDLAQELALGALIGGNLFGRLAMGPALRSITDKSERGKVLNRSWRRYGTVNTLSVATLVGAWLPAREFELGAPWNRKRDRRLVFVKDVAVGTVAVTGLVSAVTGMLFAGAAEGGAVPMESGSEPAAEASPRATKLKRLINALGAIDLGAQAGLLALNVGMRRRRTRRLLAR